MVLALWRTGDGLFGWSDSVGNAEDERPAWCWPLTRNSEDTQTNFGPKATLQVPDQEGLHWHVGTVNVPHGWGYKSCTPLNGTLLSDWCNWGS